MKLLLLLTLITLSAQASFIGTSKVDVCEDGRRYFKIESHCVTFYSESCVEVDNEYRCEYSKVENGVVGIDHVKKAAYDLEQIAIAEEANKIEQGKINMAKCDEALAYLSGNNAGKTEAEVDAMALLFADIYEALKSHRRDKAIRLITEKTVDPSLEPLRSKLLEILTP